MYIDASFFILPNHHRATTSRTCTSWVHLHLIKRKPPNPPKNPALNSNTPSADGSPRHCNANDPIAKNPGAPIPPHSSLQHNDVSKCHPHHCPLPEHPVQPNLKQLMTRHRAPICLLACCCTPPSSAPLLTAARQLLHPNPQQLVAWHLVEVRRAPTCLLAV